MSSHVLLLTLRLFEGRPGFGFLFAKVGKSIFDLVLEFRKFLQKTSHDVKKSKKGEENKVKRERGV